ncbi:MAG: hypothetical protein JOY99_01080 [Sphingomonadaceae bacterium]|nr:hypothetical protein [Sphingomonadaceae bacterium]
MATSLRRIALVTAVATACGAGFAAKAIADQPLMHQALDQLRGARDALQHAEADKGGHRVAAIRDIDMAIDEVRAGISYAR